jgi:hypothetical protein
VTARLRDFGKPSSTRWGDRFVVSIPIYGSYFLTVVSQPSGLLMRNFQTEKTAIQNSIDTF